MVKWTPAVAFDWLSLVVRATTFEIKIETSDNQGGNGQGGNGNADEDAKNTIDVQAQTTH